MDRVFRIIFGRSNLCREVFELCSLKDAISEIWMREMHTEQGMPAVLLANICTLLGQVMALEALL
jgi:hypothetical protein